MNKENEIAFAVESSGLWATIILPLAVPTTYTYTVPARLKERAQPGCRAEVVFGKQKKYAGIIGSVSDKKPDYPTKEILNVLDDAPILYPQQLQLWQWLSEYYMCTEDNSQCAICCCNNSECFLHKLISAKLRIIN